MRGTARIEWRTGLLLGLLLGCALAAQADTGSGRAQAAWWIENFGVITVAEDANVGRAQDVFDRVRAAADKRGNRLPRLVIVKGGGDPFALAIEDGSVILTRAGLERCYAGRTAEAGDARLAFLLGHELSHLAQDDFWHLAAFSAVQAHAGDRPTRARLLELLRATSDVEPGRDDGAEEAKLKELQADSYGLLYMMMAGFDPATVLDADGGFVGEWTAQSTALAAYSDPTHPGPEQRSAFLLAQLQAVRDELDLFRFGVRLVQLGRYEDAILFLDRFAERFPSREVHSNLGLAHYQLALRALHRCDPDASRRFRLFTLLDPRSLAAEPASERAAWAGSCHERAGVRRHLVPALQNLEHALASDPTYTPAGINLAAAHIVAGEASKALGVLDGIDSQAPGARNNRAVALYLFGRASSIDTMDRATRMLTTLIEEHPEQSDAVYNLARMESERGRNAAARERWAEFLALEPHGPDADIVRARLGVAAGARQRRTPSQELPRSPVPLGSISDETEARLSELDRHAFRLGIFEGQLYGSTDTSVLVIESFVEIVETRPDTLQTREELMRRYGDPQLALPSPRGETLIFPGIAFDLHEGKTRRVVHFAPGTHD